MNYYVYILHCADDTLYTGITTDISRRVDEHNGIGNSGKGAKYTEYKRPVTLVYSAGYDNRSDASKEESRIKKLTRRKKELLIHA